MALINIKIEGVSYQVEEGLTILEAAKKLPEYKFVFAGFGSAEEEIKKVTCR